MDDRRTTRIKSSQVLTPQSCTGQSARIKERGGMPTTVYTRRLFLRTSRRLRSAPVRRACIQRRPRRVHVLVCQGRRHISPHCTTRSPTSPAHRSTAVARKAKYHHLGLRQPSWATHSVAALIWQVCEKLSICSIPRKAKARMRVIVATSTVQPPAVSKLDVHDVTLSTKLLVKKCQAVG